MKNNLTILHLQYVIKKDRLKNTSFAIQHYIMKSYPTYYTPEFRVPSSPVFLCV